MYFLTKGIHLKIYVVSKERILVTTNTAHHIKGTGIVAGLKCNTLYMKLMNTA